MPQKPQYFHVLCTHWGDSAKTHLRGNLKATMKPNTSVQCGYEGSNSETKVFRDLGPKPTIPLAFGSPSHATAAQCAEEGGSVGQAGRMTGRSFSNGRLHKACTPQMQPACTHFQPNRLGLLLIALRLELKYYQASYVYINKILEGWTSDKTQACAS